MIFNRLSKTKPIEVDQTYLQSLKYETPFFVFSQKKLVDKFAEFKKHFPKAQICYALKANAEPEILQILADAGASFEAASVYELNMLKAKKVNPERIIYGTSVKPAQHIHDFYKYGVRTFACDSLSEIEKIAAMAPGSNVYVRVTVNDSGSVFKFSEKFGTEKENIVTLLKRAKELKLHPYGVSFHVGSQASNPMAWAEAIKNIKEQIKRLKKSKIKINILNIGGGYPCMYASTEYDLSLKEIAHNTLAEYKKLPYRPKLVLEPGRGLVATSGVLVTTVIGRVERKGHTWLFLDAGVYNGLFETMAYQGSTRYHVTSMRQSYDAGEMLFALAGPTGDSPDIITREALLPKDIDVGDKLIVHDVGAYSLVATSRFNGFPKPEVYVV